MTLSGTSSQNALYSAHNADKTLDFFIYPVLVWTSVVSLDFLVFCLFHSSLCLFQFTLTFRLVTVVQPVELCFFLVTAFPLASLVLLRSYIKFIAFIYPTAYKLLLLQHKDLNNFCLPFQYFLNSS
jgi:hypothetical protein